MLRPLLACVGLLISSTPVSGAPIAYTSQAAFSAALPGPANVEDFELYKSGGVIPSGSAVGGITFTYDFDGVDLIITDGNQAGGGGPFDTTSGANFLGTSDFDLLLDGDDLALGFATANAIGLYVITAELPGVTLFDGDIRLGASGATAFLDVDAVQQTLPDGSLVYFLGVIDAAASFTSASLDTFGGGGAFLFNVDDIVTAVPEPGAVALFAAGIALLVPRRRTS